MRRDAAVATVFLLLSIAMTWPLVRNMDRAVAYPGDPFINTWILDWDWWATMHAPLSLFHANAFYPARYSLAFSENLYGIAIFLMPLRAAGVAPITAYNVAVIIGFAFSGFAMYLLAFRLTGSFAGALAAGIFHAFVPFRFTHLPHLQHIWAGWIPMLLLALLWYVERPSWKRAALFALVFVMNGLTNIHWFLFGTLAVALVAALAVRRWRELIVATFGAMVILAPFLYPYALVAKMYGMTRPRMETLHFSARPADWLIATVNNRVYERLRDVSVDPERWLFPGVLSIALAAAGILAIRRYTGAVVIGLIWLAVGFAGSVGLRWGFHTFLYDAVPGFRAIRAPARWAEIAYLGMAILIAAAIAMLEQTRVKRAALALPLLFLFELRAAPIRWHLTEPEAPEVYRWLATQNLKGGIVELPIAVPESEYMYLLRATAHHKSIVNGISGFIPPYTAKIAGLWNDQPIRDELVDELKRGGVELIIMHADSLNNSDARAWLQRELTRGRLKFVQRFDGGVSGDWVFSLRGGGVAPTPQLEAFLNGQPTNNATTSGSFDTPKIEGSFSGYAYSPWSVQRVDLLFEQGSIRVPAALLPDGRFRASFPKRPDGVRVETDVQAEITDGRGDRIHLPHHWITWRDK